MLKERLLANQALLMRTPSCPIFTAPKSMACSPGMKYGPKANAEAAEAFRLDPQNAQAWAVSGRKYLYAPAMFGGDLDKAVDVFRKATLYDSNSDEDFVWLAIALQKKGDLAGAREGLRKLCA